MINACSATSAVFERADSRMYADKRMLKGK